MNVCLGPLTLTKINEKTRVNFMSWTPYDINSTGMSPSSSSLPLFSLCIAIWIPARSKNKYWNKSNGMYDVWNRFWCFQPETVLWQCCSSRISQTGSQRKRCKPIIWAVFLKTAWKWRHLSRNEEGSLEPCIWHCETINPYSHLMKFSPLFIRTKKSLHGNEWGCSHIALLDWISDF